ncbi:uncharacterized protein PSFLO_01974 [Pseudozyma flocculosa]|uniref:Uncharacterized protein n=1 Tax=Pseudozyma flocculosa TaxID=84751 RepID=A0A5C3EW77_9BASI|nr:uncharacterized protein PSFLO_01974 [Pseudozyma flocculosa]
MAPGSRADLRPPSNTAARSKTAHGALCSLGILTSTRSTLPGGPVDPSALPVSLSHRTAPHRTASHHTLVGTAHSPLSQDRPLRAPTRHDILPRSAAVCAELQAWHRIAFVLDIDLDLFTAHIARGARESCMQAESVKPAAAPWLAGTGWLNRRGATPDGCPGRETSVWAVSTGSSIRSQTSPPFAPISDRRSAPSQARPRPRRGTSTQT